MDPHPLANLFKLAACCKPIANNEEVIKENAIGLCLLNEKHDCNDIGMNSMNINCANDMQSYKLGDDEFDEHDIFSPPTNKEVIKEKYDWNKHDNLYEFK